MITLKTKLVILGNALLLSFSSYCMEKTKPKEAVSHAFELVEQGKAALVEKKYKDALACFEKAAVYNYLKDEDTQDYWCIGGMPGKYGDNKGELNVSETLHYFQKNDQEVLNVQARVEAWCYLAMIHYLGLCLRYDRVNGDQNWRQAFQLFLPIITAGYTSELHRIFKLMQGSTEIFDVDHRTPFFWACHRGRDIVHGNKPRKEFIAVINFLIELGADIHIVDKDGWSVLHRACFDGDVELVEFLLQKGLAVNGLTKSKSSPLDIACSEKSLEIVEMLVAKGAEINVANKYGNTPLHEAARQGNLAIVGFLLKQGALLEATNGFGSTPLLSACSPYSPHVEVIKFLIEQGANREARDKEGKNLLDLALKSGKNELIEYLMKSCAPDGAKSSSKTLLHETIDEDDFEAVKLIVESGRVHIDDRDKDGLTALHRVGVRRKLQPVHLEMARYLLQHGWQLEVSDKEGDTPLHIACAHGHVNLIELFIQQGADKESKNKAGNTPLFCACENGEIEAVKFLVKRGANTTVPGLLEALIKMGCPRAKAMSALKFESTEMETDSDSD